MVSLSNHERNLNPFVLSPSKDEDRVLQHPAKYLRLACAFYMN